MPVARLLCDILFLMKNALKLIVLVTLGLLVAPSTVFAATAPTISTIALSANSTTKFNHSGFLATSAGWSSPEALGTWTVASQATLKLSLPRFRHTAEIAFKSWGFVNKKNPKVTLSVFVNSKSVVTFVYSPSQNDLVRLLDIPASVLGAKFSNVPILLKISGIQSPHNLGMSLDKRNLGIYLESMTLKSLS